MIRIGRFELAGRVFLAPMAGVTDAAMRRDRGTAFGASAAVGEMIAAAGSRAGTGRRACAWPARPSEQRPDIVQIAACDPESAARAAAESAVAAGADWIDLNMGCPCKRVTGGLAGAALMRDLDLARRIVAAAVGAASVPVSVKMRLGWDECLAECAGARARRGRGGRGAPHRSRPHAPAIL